jgi:uridine kinase
MYRGITVAVCVQWSKTIKLIAGSFLLLSQAPQGVHVVSKRFPRLKIVTSEIEFGLNDDFRVIPGMGEFGDRYFGTDDYQSSTPLFCEDKNRVR